MLVPNCLELVLDCSCLLLPGSYSSIARLTKQKEAAVAVAFAVAVPVALAVRGKFQVLQTTVVPDTYYWGLADDGRTG